MSKRKQKEKTSWHTAPGAAKELIDRLWSVVSTESKMEAAFYQDNPDLARSQAASGTVRVEVDDIERGWVSLANSDSGPTLVVNLGGAYELDVIIRIRPGATAREIHAAVPNAMAHLQRIMEGDNRTIDRRYAEKFQGVSYASAASELNKHVVKLICMAVEAEKRIERESIQPSNQYYLLPYFVSRHAVGFLNQWGVPRPKARKLIREGMGLIRSGEDPLPTMPFTGENVKKKIQYHRPKPNRSRGKN